MTSLDDIERRLDGLDPEGACAGPEAASELLALGEAVLDHWVRAKGHVPTRETREGFRLLALHRQGCTGDPSFNACRETCRELVYHYNLVTAEPQSPLLAHRVRLMTMVARHLYLFATGKMQVAALGDFCCASRPLRQEVGPPDAA